MLQIVPEGFVEYYRDLVRRCSVSGRNNTVPELAAELAEQVGCIIVVVKECTQLLESTNGYHSELALLRNMHQTLARNLRILVYGVNECTVPPLALHPSYQIHSGGRGRPRVVINVDHVELLRSCGYTWNEVADAIQVSRTTIWRRLRDAGVHLSKYSDISDQELDTIVVQFQNSNPNYGQQLMHGHLKAQGIHIQRRRLRECVQRTDPLRRHLCWHQTHILC